MMRCQSALFGAILCIGFGNSRLLPADTIPGLEQIRQHYAASLKVMDKIDVTFRIDSVYKPEFFELGVVSKDMARTNEARIRYRLLADGERWRLENRVTVHRLGTKVGVFLD